LENVVVTVSPSKPKKLTGHYFGMIYGEPGAGKTTLCARAPGPVVHVDTGNESLTLAYDPELADADVYKCGSHQEIMEVVMDVRIKKIPCRTLIIDNCTDQQRLRLRQSSVKLVKGRDFDGEIIPIQQDYNIVFTAMGSMFDVMKDNKFPADILLVAHRKEYVDEKTKAQIIRPNLTPALSDRVSGDVDFMLLLEKKVNMMRKETTRTLRASSTNIIEAKNRVGLPDEFPAEDFWHLIEERRDNSEDQG
jgi:hypothetical protein